MSESSLHPTEQRSPNSSHHAAPPLRTYFMVYIALLVLLALTVAVGEIQLGTFGIVLALIIAIVKAVLVLLFFMHLRYSSRLTMLIAVAGFAWLVIMFTFMLADYISRGWVGQ